jgi:urease accessory protein
MLLGLGATVEDVSEPFNPEGGAYEGGAAGHAHAGGSGHLAGLAHDPP